MDIIPDKRSLHLSLDRFKEERRYDDGRMYGLANQRGSTLDIDFDFLFYYGV